MSWKPDRYQGLRTLLWGTRVAEEVDEEFAHHVDSLVADFVARGMTEPAARAEAQRRFGDVARLKAETVGIDESMHRERRRAEHLSVFARELRYAFRSLGRSRAFALAAVVTLGLGIGAATSIYTLLDAVVLRPLPYPEADRLVHISARVPETDPGARWGLSEAGYHHYHAHAATLSDLAVVGSTWGGDAELTVTGEFGAERVRAGVVSAPVFDVLGIMPARGRPFREADERPDATPVAILGWDYWQRQYGGADVLGRTLMMGAVPTRIVGVMPAGAHLPEARVDVWLPAPLDPAREAVNSHWIDAVGRLRPGATVADAQAELDRLTARFPELFPNWNAYGGGFFEQTGFHAVVVPLHDDVVGAISRTLWILLGSVLLVLVIACANVSNLFLVRVESRRREVAMRAALGARRRDLAWHYLGESVLIAAGAIVVALVLAHGAMQVMTALAPPGFPRLAEVALTNGALLATLGAGAAAALVFGLLPLLQPAFRPQILRDGGQRAGVSRRRRVVRSGLVVAQTALALLLLAGAGLMLESYRQLRSVQLGFEPRDALTFDVAIPPAHYADWAQVASFHQQLLERIELLPGVVAAGATTFQPMPDRVGCAGLFVEGRTIAAGDRPPCLPVGLATPGTFAALGTRLRGAPSDWPAVRAGAGGAVVTQSLAERLWPGEDPIGKGIRGGGDQPPYYHVIAVTEPLRLHAVDDAPLEAVFFPFMPAAGVPLWTPPHAVTVIVRTAGVAPLALVEPIRAELAELDAQVPIAHVRTLESVVARSAPVARTSFTLILLLVAGVIALVLSAVGVYGVISYVVAQRTSEIGLRLALGAHAGEVKAMVVRQSLALVAAGLVIGLGATVLATRALRSLLFDVSPTDPVVLAGVTIVLVTVAALASYLPARRAARVEPMSVLRTE